MRQPLAGGDAGVVDQRVDPAVLRPQPLGERGPAGLVGDVEGPLGHAGGGRLREVEHVGRHDQGTGSGQGVDLGRALSTRGSGDHDDLAVQLAHVDPLSGLGRH